MSRFRGWAVRFFRTLFPRRFDAEMEAEMQAHRELEAEALRLRGVNAQTAERLAGVHFGSVEAYKESARDRRLGRLLYEIVADAGYAVRQYRNAPGFSSVAVLTLALGIGASTAMLSALDGIMFRPMPYPEPERLMLVFEVIPGNQINNPSGGAYIDWRTHQTKFEGLSLTQEISRNARAGTVLERLNGSEVTHEFFRVLGVRPVLGRTFLPEEDRAGGENRVVVITEELWRSRFGGSPNVLNSTMSLDEVPHTIIGVVPKDYIVPSTKYFVPAVATLSPTGKYSRGEHWATVVGRLRPGVAPAEAEAELRAIKQQLQAEYPPWKKDWDVAVRAPRPLLTDRIKPVALTLVGAASIVLLIACANVANLLLARSTHRRQELALRSAVGATTGRIVRQLLTESVFLALLGGAGGVLLAAWSVDLLRAATADYLPPALAPVLDMRVLAAAVAVTFLTGLVFGVLPAWRSRHLDVNDALKNGGRSASVGRSRSQSFLIIAEVALSVVLLSSAGLLLRSLAETIAADPGFEPARALAFDLTLPRISYPTPEVRLAFSNTLQERLRALPGVENVGTGMSLPFAGGGYGEKLSAEGKTASYTDPNGRLDFVSPGYLQALGARLLAGRWLQESDNRPDGARVAVVSDSVVSRIFDGEMPIGRKVRVSGTFYEVVGVIATMPDRNKDDKPSLFVYAPQAFDPSAFSVVVRTSGKPETVISQIREKLREIDAGLPIANVRTMDQAMHGSLGLRRLVLTVIGGFAIVSLVLACIGLYGVMAYSVGMRAREFSIRLALGAARWDVVRLVLTDGMQLVAWGLGIGLLFALASAHALRSQLYGISPNDPGMLSATLLVLAGVSLFACGWPALRATRANALSVLRAD